MIIDFKLYRCLPIIRYLCKQKGPKNPNHRTFSLLLHPLIPYHKNALNVIVEAVNYQQHSNASAEQIKRVIGAKGHHDYIALENRQLDHFQQLFIDAYTKLATIAERKQRHQCNWQKDRGNSEPVVIVLEVIDGYQSNFVTTNASRAEQLALDFFYHFQTDCFFNRQFLFGTASQQRH